MPPHKCPYLPVGWNLLARMVSGDWMTTNSCPFCGGPLSSSTTPTSGQGELCSMELPGSGTCTA